MATKTKGKPLDDSEVLSLLDDSIKTGVKFTDTKLAKERQRVIQYYNGQLPAPMHGGNSKYVSTDVFDATESMKSTIVEAFSASSDIVQFAAKGEEDAEEARIATAYTKHVVFEQNDGINLFRDVVHDGLTARVAVAKCYWEDKVDEIEETFEDLDHDSLSILIADDEVELKELEFSTDNPDVASGTITRREDNSQVRIELLPPEEFIVNPSIKSLEGEPLSHRTEKTKSDLIKCGYDKSLVEKLSYSDASLSTDPERLARFDQIGSSSSFGSNSESGQDATRIFVVYETYADLDMDGSGVAKLWRIVHCGSVLLDKQEVDRHPFKVFVPLPVPHSFYGTNWASKLIPVQNAKTVLTRSILDHAVVANNPRYGVVKGSLTNPRELIDNRIGGLVNVTRPDGIFPIPQAPLNPFVFQTISMLDEDKEDATGVSRLSQGLNKDAISSQNSQAMVEQLIGASMQRQKTIARNFATQFLGPLFVEVYRLVVENEKKQKVVDIAGSWVPVTPSSWRKMRDVSVDLRLGYGERDQMASEYLQFGQLLGNDPQVAHLYGTQERYNLYKMVAEIKGHKNISQFLADPKTTQPPPPDPMVAAQLAVLQQEPDINDRKMKLAEAEFQANTALDKMKDDFEKRFKSLEYALKVQDSERKDADVANRIDVSQKELALAEKDEAETPPENKKASAIISPNG